MMPRPPSRPSRRGLILSGAALASVLAGLAPTHAAAAAPSRIVAVGGAVTEILWALGLGDAVVGVDTTSSYPPEALATRRPVGYMRALSAEGVLSLAPTLVLAVEGAGPPDALKLIREAGVRVELVPDDFSEAGVAARVRAIGRVVGREGEAERIALDVERGLATLAADRARVTRPVRVMFIIALQNGRPMAAGSTTAADAIIRMAGAINVFADLQGYKPVADEAVIAAAPDVILTMSHTAAAADPERLFALPAFAATPAAAARRVYRMDGQYLLGFGPRTPQAVGDLLRQLHPEVAAR